METKKGSFRESFLSAMMDFFIHFFLFFYLKKKQQQQSLFL